MLPAATGSACKAASASEWQAGSPGAWCQAAGSLAAAALPQAQATTMLLFQSLEYNSRPPRLRQSFPVKVELEDIRVRRGD